MAHVHGRSGKALIEQVPLYKQRWRVSETDLHKISELLRPEWWERFATKLRLHEEVEKIKGEYSNLESQSFKLLLKWNNKYKSEATYCIILEALDEINEINALDCVCMMLHAQSKPGEPLSTALERYSDALKKKYSEYMLKSIVDWPPASENIVELAMICNPEIDQQFIGNITRGNVKNVLNVKMEIDPNALYEKIETSGIKLIVLEGAPGSGKTTMCLNICKQWGEGEIFKSFSLVIMIELRKKNVRKAKSIADILPHCSKAEKERCARELENEQGEGVLIILEGWNELPEGLQEESPFEEIIKKDGHGHLENATILVTSRSNTTVSLHQHTSIHVEVLGFKPEQIKEYIQKCFESNGKPERARELLQLIDRNPRLKENCYLPLMLIIIVHLFNRKKSLPESFCSIVMELALSCLYRYYTNRGRFHIRDADPIPTFKAIESKYPDIQEELDKVCELAYDGIITDSYLLSESETDGLGLLQNVRNIRGRGSELTQYFLHSSLQELCAALHISRQPVDEQKDILEKLFDTPKDYVIRFYSALTKWENETTRKVLFEQSEKICSKRDIMLPPMKEVPLSQSLVSVPNKLMMFHKRHIKLWSYMLKKETQLDRDKLLPLVVMIEGSSQYQERFARINANLLEEVMKRTSNESFDPEDLIDIFENYKEAMCKELRNISSENGMDSDTFAPAFNSLIQKLFFESIKSVFENIKSFFENIESSHQKLVESDDKPQLADFLHVVQKYQQDLVKKFQEDPTEEKSGLPVARGQEISQQFKSLFWEQVGNIRGDPKYHEFMMTIMQQDPKKCLKTFTEFINRTSLASPTAHKLNMLIIARGKIKQTILMLIHCVYEAQNPMLSSILSSPLVVVGNINWTALKYVLNQSKISTLYLMTALSPTQTHMVANALRSSTELKELFLSIGQYDDTIARQALAISEIRKLRYKWVNSNERECLNSCKSVSEHLQHNQSLQVLDLSTVQIGEGAECIAGVLNTTRIVELNLSRCGINDNGVSHIAQALIYNYHLRRLYLHNTKLSAGALKCLSRSLRRNNTLQVLGLVEDPATSEISEEILQQFTLQFCFNSSVTSVMLNAQCLRKPAVLQALAVVNCTRKLKQQPLLSLDDHYPINYNAELHSITGINEHVIRTPGIKSINCRTVLVTLYCQLTRELPCQIWMQTLPFTLYFISQTKRIANTSLRCLLKPRVKSITINVESVEQLESKPFIMAEAERILLAGQDLHPQDQQHTLSNTLNLITRFKAIRTMCMRKLLPQRNVGPVVGPERPAKHPIVSQT